MHSKVNTRHHTGEKLGKCDYTTNAGMGLLGRGIHISKLHLQVISIRLWYDSNETCLFQNVMLFLQNRLETTSEKPYKCNN